MIWWNRKALRESLATGTLPERAKMIYLLLFLVAFEGLWLLLQIDPMPLNAWGVGNSALSLLLIIAGTVWLYRQNGGSTGRAFIERALAVSWVIALRLILIAVPLGMAAFAIETELMGGDPDAELTYGPIDLAITLVFGLAYYLWVGAELRAIRQRESDVARPPATAHPTPPGRP